MKKLIVYTVLTGDDSQLNNPFDESWVGFDRVCLTDDLSLSSDIWQIKPVQNLSIDPHRLSRHPKILTHEYFPDHEWSLYLDNTVRLTKNPMEILEEYADKGSLWWSFRHPWRNCIYDEAEEVIKYDLDLELIVRNQMDFYKANGYPQHQGLNANTFLLRKHNDAAVISFSKLWFFLYYCFQEETSFHLTTLQI